LPLLNHAQKSLKPSANFIIRKIQVDILLAHINPIAKEIQLNLANANARRN